MSTPTGYSTLQIALHWLIAILIVGAFFTHEAMEAALENRIETGATGLEGATPHTIMGGLAFFLILIRIVVRLKRGAPGVVAGTSPMMEIAATMGHRLLYLLMLLVPAIGAATWYAGLPLGNLHEIIGKLLMIVALGHALIAIGHAAAKRDGVLTRMFRPE